MVDREKTVITFFALLSQALPIYLYTAVKGGIPVEDISVVLTSTTLAVVGLSIITILLSDHLKEKLTLKHYLEAPLLSTFFVTLMFFTGFFWLFVEVKPYISIETDFLWLFILSQILPIVILFIFITIFSSSE